MDGTVLDGELREAAAAPRGRMRFATATPADDPAIRRLLRENPMRGAIALTLEREPDYFRGTGVGGTEDHTLLAFDRERLVCMGHCSTRPRWLNGEVRRVGYLGELRLDAAARGRAGIVRRGYRFFHESQRRAPADFYFTSIAADNLRARRLLERGVRDLPRYSFLAGFTTLVIPTQPLARGAHIEDEHARAEPEELAAFLNAEGRRTQLAAAWTAEQLRSLGAHGLAPGHFRVLRDGGGRIVACAALWDQRGFRQTVIRGYATPLAWARPLLNTLAPLLGRPDLRLPPRDSVLAQAFASPLVVAPGAEHRLPGLLASLGQTAARRGLAYLTLGFPSDHPLLALVRQNFRARTYLSRLYRVQWPGDPAPALDPGPFLPEVALL